MLPIECHVVAVFIAGLAVLSVYVWNDYYKNRADYDLLELKGDKQK